MAVSWLLPVRAVQFVFAIITLGLSGWLISYVSIITFSQADFNLFAALWTMIVSAFFIATSFVMTDSILTNPIIVLVLDGISWIFWLSAWACMAAEVATADRYFDNIIDTFRSVMKADVAFGVFEWLLFSATLIFNGLTSFRGTKTSGGAPPAAQGV